ncbi:helix-turn-helix domain-containing protein [Ramlibacter sp. AN1015]|uniref:helix-turn-helix domain-containing protein n=1 Tax=Ramlibacter sp. AN1015 TaxID=3133428 RepID=UPI0030BA6DB1
MQANVYACINLIGEGLVQRAGRPLPRVFVTGPFSRPVDTVVPGVLASASVVMQPWLLGPLLGIDAAEAVDQIVSLELEQITHHALDALARHPGDEAARTVVWQALERFLGSTPPAGPRLSLDALRSGGVESAAAACGCSARQYRRRFQQAMGLAPAAWLRITRWERAVLQFARLQSHGSLAEVSVASGYADQAHMTR